MRVDEAAQRLAAIVRVPFGELFPHRMRDIHKNKGRAGQLIMQELGLPLDSELLDLEDGEIKTYKADANGLPRETTVITQIGSEINTMLFHPDPPFSTSRAYLKLKNLLICPIWRDPEDPAQWFIHGVHHVSIPQDSPLYRALAEDYRLICEQLRREIRRGGQLRTLSGHFLQIRPKDFGDYTPTTVRVFGRISDKSYGFYVKKSFMQAILAGKAAG